jgi:anti-sigma regulatory factor (Ser/Thr protein kinase)
MPVVGGDPILDVALDRDLTRMRGLLRDRLRRTRLRPDRVEELTLAVSEVSTNALRHARSRSRLLVWDTDGRVVCEVSDDGGGVPDPLAGYVPPGPGAASGMGLWVVRQLCDEVAIESTTHGTRVRFAISRGSKPYPA